MLADGARGDGEAVCQFRGGGGVPEEVEDAGARGAEEAGQGFAGGRGRVSEMVARPRAG